MQTAGAVIVSGFCGLVLGWMAATAWVGVPDQGSITEPAPCRAARVREAAAWDMTLRARPGDEWTAAQDAIHAARAATGDACFGIRMLP